MVSSFQLQHIVYRMILKIIIISNEIHCQYQYVSINHLIEQVLVLAANRFHYVSVSYRYLIESISFFVLFFRSWPSVWIFVYYFHALHRFQRFILSFGLVVVAGQMYVRRNVLTKMRIWCLFHGCILCTGFSDVNDFRLNFVFGFGLNGRSDIGKIASAHYH